MELGEYLSKKKENTDKIRSVQKLFKMCRDIGIGWTAEELTSMYGYNHQTKNMWFEYILRNNGLLTRPRTRSNRDGT